MNWPKSFGVSIMPVREALSRLTAEQVLVLLPNRSVAVPTLTADRFAQITKVRLMLEGMAAADGAGLIKQKQIDEMAELNARMDQLDIDDHKTYLDLNRMFHFTIYKASGQDYLVALIESLWMQAGPLLNILLQDPEHAGQRRYIHHHDLIEALRRRDANAARDAIAGDIGDAADIIMQTLSHTDELPGTE